ncbi:MAG TPA: SCO family protein [Alphaproteobacteria bacterium]|nr:hypothetical protein [Rhodospirillaceae bacterium]HRJ66876.1 SCO family protein [Alphaproteobacteria bacterium]
MKNILKFTLLALVAFAMGAALAWFQSRQNAPAPVAVELTEQQQQALDIKPAPVGERPRDSVVEGAPDMPDALDSLYGDEAAEKADATAEGAAEAAAEAAPAETQAADAAPAAPEGQKVAGSSVGGTFSMTDHNGNAVTEKSWPGKKKLVFFGFTHCPDICPAALDKIGAALKEMGADADKIQPIFVTTDPKRDTSARLKEYLADYDSRVVGLTGTDEQVEHIKSIYKVYAAIAEGGDADNYLMDHSGYIYLMSEDDALLEIFGSDSTAETIVQKSAAHLK